MQTGRCCKRPAILSSLTGQHVKGRTDAGENLTKSLPEYGDVHQMASSQSSWHCMGSDEPSNST